jgi:hypothetical protein
VKSINHDTTVVNAGRKDRTDMEIKKPYAAFRCIKLMKGIGSADQLLFIFSGTAAQHRLWPPCP